MTDTVWILTVKGVPHRIDQLDIDDTEYADD